MQRLPLVVYLVWLLLGCGGRTGLESGPRVDPHALDPDVCIELPPAEPPRFVDVAFTARIETADVLMLVDTTSSMSTTLLTIQDSLRDDLIPSLLANVPDVRVGIASFQDYDRPHSRIYPFRLHQRMTTDLEDLQRAVNEFELRSGLDGPEAQVEALYQAATGAGHPGYVPRAHCPRDTVGYPCFRQSGARVILLFTDAYFHAGPGGAGPYQAGSITPPPATYGEAVEALNAIGAKVLGFFAGGAESAGAMEDLRGVARDTHTITSEGEPIVFDIGPGARGLREGVADSVQRLVEQVPINVDLLLEPLSAEVDASVFVSRVQALAASPADGALIEADAFRAVRPGTRLRFRLQFENDSIPRLAEPQRFYLRVVLQGDGITRLKETTVEVLVPSIDGVGCEAEGLETGPIAL